ncbi:type II toxin-antitoxin system RelE/ParE family toxin [Novosphingobium sp.]|uniref:type II toxin-antitoxin system RelE/ParE family toxin n=1 Tax=Novosphingobium sp. TaxID=1874826 RepID=UPI002606CCB0|nr:type II toxin-antitoxin system RelE/ParE family toxin [Novosphingobium sp.]
MNRSYVLSQAADSDLEAIVRYTRDQWGAAQARHYAATLRRGIERLASGAPPFRQASERHPALRVARCEHHFIFCLPQEEGPALIVAILHKRMDLIARVAARLE